ncbi:hypothetical protein [uncultured Abyssibacter sp.]|uniref:hypothetical protein n=1 Tax=uncultured Abyssibacter sp. TaxID=2320202 RepID=UPI0032B2CCB5
MTLPTHLTEGWNFSDQIEFDRIMNTLTITGQYRGRPHRFRFFVAGVQGFLDMHQHPVEDTMAAMRHQFELFTHLAVIAFKDVYGERNSRGYFITQVMLERLAERYLGRAPSAQDDSNDQDQTHTGDTARPGNKRYRR